MSRKAVKEVDIGMVAPFPPPMHGAGKNSQKILVDLTACGSSVEAYGTNPSGARAHYRDLSYHWKRVKTFVGNLRQVHRCNTLYVVPDGGGGIIYSAAYVIFAAQSGCTKVFLHHRNYSHIDKPNFLMRLLCKVGGARMHHIFLDDLMAERFSRVYRCPNPHLVVSNAATNDLTPVAQDDVRVSDFVTVGFLSNLSIEKGFDDVYETFVALKRLGSNYRFKLAGAPVSDVEARILSQMRLELGDALTYTGHIEGSDKQEFFRSIDFFLFPTKYRAEAQPNVIFEAFASGCVVVATGRACIPKMCEEVDCCVIDSGDHFPSLAVEYIRSMDEASLLSTRRRVVGQYARIQIEAVVQYRRFIDVLSKRDPIMLSLK